MLDSLSMNFVYNQKDQKYKQMEKQKFISHILNVHEMFIEEQIISFGPDYPHQLGGNLFIGSIKSIKPENILKYNITAVVSVINNSRYKNYEIEKNLQIGLLGAYVGGQSEKNQQKNFEQKELQQLKKTLSLKHMFIDVGDHAHTQISPYFKESYEFIRNHLFANPEQQIDFNPSIKKKLGNRSMILKRGGNVLVHCMGGKSRSCTILIAFLTKFIQQKLINNKTLSEGEKEQMLRMFVNYERILQLVRQRHPIGSPNEGFQKQLRSYTDCLMKRIEQREKVIQEKKKEKKKRRQTEKKEEGRDEETEQTFVNKEEKQQRNHHAKKHKREKINNIEQKERQENKAMNQKKTKKKK